ncbi:MAG: SDR family NAD(P)-dependent oxidoreductase [Vicinamibacterales bacterium]
MTASTTRHEARDGASRADLPARRTVLVTGASAGIGAAFARVFAANEFDLVLTARRRDRLEALAEALREAHGAAVRVLPADLADPDAPRLLHDDLTGAGIVVDALVNNAGYGMSGTFLKSPWPEHQKFLQVMLLSVVELTRLFMPGMVERGYGRILNVSSLAGLLPGTAGHTLYAAVKAFLVKFSQSLAFEGAPHGVHATALCPGFTYSEFHDVNGTRALVSRLPRWMWLDADTVARDGYEAVMNGRVVAITGRINRLLYAASRHAPEVLLLRAMKRQAKRYRITE